ncbi:hypothetical protein [Chthonobacter rhizosphaerae]|uniref:hypothetical protein n=1 Tax=Chthonobacter rhizosphaerae TaxID=2735553 RepID=UPI0015EEC882|nr:hypothetical protein [Chthonobacter rhizosphaerae]
MSRRRQTPDDSDDMAAGFAEVMADLLLIDFHLMKGHVLRREHGNIADLVESAAELVFPAGTVAYAGECALVSTDGGDRVRLTVAFRHEGLGADLGFDIGPEEGRVHLLAIRSAGDGRTDGERLDDLRAAIRDCRVNGSRAARRN